MQQIRVPQAEAGRRIDKYLMKYFDAAPKSFIYKAFRKKNIKLCGKRAAGNELLNEGDLIELFFSDETIASMRKTPVGNHKVPAGDKATLREYCEIVYEDKDVIFADKRENVLSQKAEPGDYSLNEALLDYCGGKPEASSFIPSVCNRIDRNTTGLVCFVKSYKAARLLSEMLRDRSLEKYYLAAVSGVVNEAAHVEAWLVKDKKSNKVTVYDRPSAGVVSNLTDVESSKPTTSATKGKLGKYPYTFVKVELITGKSHQIRAQLAAMGHPLLGDLKYGSRELNKYLAEEYGIRSQLLHAWEMHFPKDTPSPLDTFAGKSVRTKTPEWVKQLRIE